MKSRPSTPLTFALGVHLTLGAFFLALVVLVGYIANHHHDAATPTKPSPTATVIRGVLDSDVTTLGSHHVDGLPAGDPQHTWVIIRGTTNHAANQDTLCYLPNTEAAKLRHSGGKTVTLPCTQTAKLGLGATPSTTH